MFEPLSFYLGKIISQKPNLVVFILPASEITTSNKPFEGKYNFLTLSYSIEYSNLLTTLFMISTKMLNKFGLVFEILRILNQLLLVVIIISESKNNRSKEQETANAEHGLI